ncbi:DUF2066 domain-containing protein [Shewanella subflava]|uniref:DUF2066 domain-containing protein n=1 Tax=Shewanella subflava TaxID=2986476 RepID=A0ABT3IDB3_9GAMM|nr:DUF2066 domain-containing protein [Shewanella subflava]MCW3174041.1 DUF2066 domain-containing protein [Shewanella subflava]
MLKKLLTFIFMTLSFSHAQVFAAEVQKLDEADIVVTSRADSARSSALKEALASVFLKNSGSPSVVMNPMVKAQIENPEALLIQYGYSQVNEDLIFKASFDHQGVINILRQANLPVWGAQRPLTLLWVTMAENNETVILSDSSQNPLRMDFATESSNKGIPVLLPLMDLDDLMAVTPTDVKGMFINPVNIASSRYQADYFAMVDIDESQGKLRFQLALYNKAHTGALLQPIIMQQGEAVDVTSATKRIVTLLANYYISQYAIASSGNNLETSVSFTGVSSMKQVVEIEKYLKQLSAVKEVAVSKLSKDTITYKLGLFSSVEDLQRLLSIDARLSKIDTMGDANSYLTPQTNNDTSLIYEWKSQ